MFADGNQLDEVIFAEEDLLYLHPKAAEMKTFTMEYTPLDLARSVSNFSNKKCIELLEDIEGTVFSFRNAQQRDGK